MVLYKGRPASLLHSEFQASQSLSQKGKKYIYLNRPWDGRQPLPWPSESILQCHQGNPEHPLSLSVLPPQRTPPSWQPSHLPRSSISSLRRQPASLTSLRSCTHPGWLESARSAPIPHPWSGGGLAAWEPMGMGKRWVGRVHSLQGLDSTGSRRTT